MVLAGLPFALVLAAACCHATWNYAAHHVKGDIGVLALGTAIAFVTGLPLAVWQLHVTDYRRGAICVVASGIVNFVYFLLLSRSYSVGDLSLVYPVARGTGVTGTVLVAAALLHEQLTPHGAIGIACVVGGVLCLGLPTPHCHRGAGFGSWFQPSTAARRRSRAEQWQKRQKGRDEDSQQQPLATAQQHPQDIEMGLCPATPLQPQQIPLPATPASPRLAAATNFATAQPGSPTTSSANNQAQPDPQTQADASVGANDAATTHPEEPHEDEEGHGDRSALMSPMSPAIALPSCDRRGVVLALSVGCCTSTYSIVDKLGVEVVSPVAYIVGLVGVQLAFLLPFALIKHRRRFTHAVRDKWRYAAIVGIGSNATYLLVLFALRLAHASYVFAARELSVVLATLLGFTVLHEPVTPLKLAGVLTVVSGLVLMKLY